MSRADLTIEQLVAMVQEMSGYDGSFEELNVYENDDFFFDSFFSDNPAEAVRAAYFGNYSFNDDYVRFDGYGNLESLSEYDYEIKLDNERDNIVDRYIQMVLDGDIDNEWVELDTEIAELEEAEEE